MSSDVDELMTSLDLLVGYDCKSYLLFAYAFTDRTTARTGYVRLRRLLKVNMFQIFMNAIYVAPIKNTLHAERIKESFKNLVSDSGVKMLFLDITKTDFLKNHEFYHIMSPQDEFAN